MTDRPTGRPNRDQAAHVARRAFAEESLGVRLHAAGRWRSCPFPEIAAAVPTRGAILDGGCGHGLFSLYLAASAPERRVTAVDIDERKLPVARRGAASAGLTDRVRFASIPPGWTPADQIPADQTPADWTLHNQTPRAEGAPGESSPRWDAIVEVDMLYLLGHDAAIAWLRSAADALTPGGRLVVKEVDTHPGWKHQVARLQELLATKVLRITRGEVVEQLPSAAVVAALEAGGLTVEITRLDRWRLHPDYLVVGTRS